MDLAILPKITPFILKGAVVTVRMVLLVLLIGTPLAVLVALGRDSRSLWVSVPLGILSAFVRGLPPLLILFCAYFVLPLLGIKLEPFPAAVVGLTLYIVFYFAECVRGGLAAVPAGQRMLSARSAYPRCALSAASSCHKRYRPHCPPISATPLRS